MAVTWALIDPLMTVARPVAAFFSAFVTGVLEDIFVPEDTLPGSPAENGLSCQVDACCDGKACPPEEHSLHHSFREKMQAGLKFAVTDVWNDLASWFLAGLLIAGVITVLFPADLFTSHLGGGIGSMFFMLALGIPVYICATASTPVAAALIMKGVSPGTALVFLLAGPATNITSLSVITGILGRRGTTIYLVSLSICAVVSGLLLDALYLASGITASAVIGQASEIFPPWIKTAAALVLLGISVRPVAARIKSVFVKRTSEKCEQESSGCCPSSKNGPESGPVKRTKVPEG